MIPKDRFDTDLAETTVQGDSTRLLENEYSTQQTKENECCFCPTEKCCTGWKRDVIFFILGLFFTMAVGGSGFFIYLKTDGSSSDSTVQPHVPNAPTILSTITSSSSIFFTYSHNLTTIDPVHKFELILNYKSNKQIIQLADLGLSYQANITGLLSGETYGIEIRGNNSIGVGPWTSFQQLTEKTSLPPTPRELSLVTVEQEGTQAIFSIKPEGDGGSLLTRVQLQTADDAKIFSCDINPYNRSSRTEKYEEVKCTVSNLTQSATTFVSASLCNNAGCGGFTGQIECLFVADDTSLCTRPSPKPNAPTNVQVLNTDPLLLSWDPSKDSSGKKDETVTHYQIRLDDPWYGGGLAIVTMVESTTYTNTTILPGSTYNYQIRAITSDQQSEWTALGNLKTKEKGTCGNEADIRQWRTNFPDLESKSEKCGRRHIGDKSGCEKCLQDSLGFSLDCGGCWFDEGMCTVHNCVTKCLTHHCQECWDKHCSPNFQSCTGMPSWTFPPVTS